MIDLAVGFGLVLVIEGLLWALAPSLGVRVLEAAASTPQQALRMVGLVTMAIGVAVVWLVRG